MNNPTVRKPVRPTFPTELTDADIALMKRIKMSVLNEGHNVEIKGTSDGKLKVLEVKKKDISIG